MRGFFCLVARASLQADAINLTRRTLALARDHVEHFGATMPEVSVTGHSSGGTLAQITAHHLGEARIEALQAANTPAEQSLRALQMCETR